MERAHESTNGHARAHLWMVLPGVNLPIHFHGTLMKGRARQTHTRVPSWSCSSIMFPFVRRGFAWRTRAGPRFTLKKKSNMSPVSPVVRQVTQTEIASVTPRFLDAWSAFRNHTGRHGCSPIDGSVVTTDLNKQSWTDNRSQHQTWSATCHCRSGTWGPGARGRA